MTRFMAGVAVGAFAYPAGLFLGALIARRSGRPAYAFGVK